MKENNEATSGAAEESTSGDLDKNVKTDTSDSVDPVSPQYAKKLLTEKRNAMKEVYGLRDKLQAFETQEKDRVESELKQQEDYKKLVELKEKEIVEVKAKLEDYDRQFKEGTKLNAFLDAVGGDVDEKFWGLINANEIMLNPETGIPEEASVNEVVRNFKSKYSEVIRTASGPRTTNDAPQGSAAPLGLDQWKKLPAKEKRERLAEVHKEYVNKGV